MKPWTKILPFLIVRYVAIKYLERFTVGGELVVIPYPGVYIKVTAK